MPRANASKTSTESGLPDVEGGHGPLRDSEGLGSRLVARLGRVLNPTVRRAIEDRLQAAFDLKPDSEKLTLKIETDLSRRLVVGSGTVLLLRGWCSHPSKEIVRLEILVDGVPRAVAEYGLNSVDARPRPLEDEPSAGRLATGFVAMVPFPALAAARSASLSVRARLRGGRVAEASLGALYLVPSARQPIPLPANVASTPGAPLIAICLATYQPPLPWLKIQLDSLINQTHKNWICIVNDDASPLATWEKIQQLTARDPRFVAFRNPERLGFYANFERALERVPKAVDYVALCDQDDAWYPDKLSASLAEFRPDTTLVYCDMNLVSRDGAKLSDTYWTTRRNNYTDFETLLIANTVTGAASVFRADLLGDVLPFPQRVTGSYHDHWIACMAMVRGRLGYVDRPLYAYRQHGGNVVGHAAPEPSRIGPAARTVLRLALTWPLTRTATGHELRNRLLFHDTVFNNDVVRIAALAKTLELRAGDVSHERAVVIHRFARLHRSVARLALEGIKYELTDRPSLGLEWYYLKGAVGHRLYHAYYRGLARAQRGRNATKQAAPRPAT